MARALPIPLAILAQSGASSEQSLGIIVALTVIVVVAVVVAIIGFFIWRRFTHSEEPSTSRKAAFSLADLRRLHQEGQLTDAEFERAKAAIIAQTRAALALHPEGEGDNPPDDLSPQADKPDEDDESNHSR